MPHQQKQFQAIEYQRKRRRHAQSDAQLLDCASERTE
jgi:hypothetical protein